MLLVKWEAVKVGNKEQDKKKNSLTVTAESAHAYHWVSSFFYSLGAGLFVPAKLLVEHLHDHGTAELRNRVVLHTDRLGHGVSETCTALKVDLCAVLVTLELLDDGPLGVCLLQNSRLSVTVLDRLVQVLDRRLIVVLNSVCLCSISEEK